ncbi:putative pectinesterase 11 [Silene latifolia]|uniref:putative pectinesterase 11 n=1 Tax=Silene latifolia TaxID=37657 RepID=UPI003D77C6C9
MCQINKYVHFYIFFGITLTCIMQAISFRCDENKLKWEQEIYVDSFGLGDFESIQEAIDSIPSGNVNWTIIRIEPGIYREKIIVPEDKPHIILSGSGAKSTIITGNLGGGIFNSSIVSIFASNFVAKRLTIENTHKPGTQAVALRVRGDKVAFYSCRFIGYQDTLLDEKGRHYYKNCYIEGTIDFICGNAASLFDHCHIHCIAPKAMNGVITAQRRTTWEENTGFYFTKSNITGVNNCYLGRPWGNYSRVVFAHTHMSSAVLPLGWNDWNKPFTQSTVYYGEHDCYGPGSDRSSRVAWSRSLTSDEALPFLWFLA